MARLSFTEYANQYGVPSIPYTPELRDLLRSCGRNDTDKLVSSLGMEFITYPRAEGDTRNFAHDNTFQVIVSYPAADVHLCVAPDDGWCAFTTADKQGRPLHLASIGTDSLEGMTHCLASQVAAKLEAVSRLPSNRVRNTTPPAR